MHPKQRSMQFLINNQVIKIRTFSELINQFSILGYDFNGMTPSEIFKECDPFYNGGDIELCHLLLSPFNIPMTGNFANRSAINLCSNCQPTIGYAVKTLPTFAEYILSILKITTRYILHTYLKAFPLTKSGFIDIRKIEVDKEKIINDILLNIDIVRTHNILRFVKQPYYSGPVTQNIITMFMQQHNLIDGLTICLSEDVIDELDLEDSDFNRTLIESVCPNTPQGWFFLQKYYRLKGIAI